MLTLLGDGGEWAAFTSLLASFFFFSGRRRHTRCSRDWSSGVCSSDLSPAFCAPPRPWALWTSQSPSIIALSRPVGTIGLTQMVPISNGMAISGWFTYTAQRTDLYTDPLGVLAIRGSFVAPLVTDRTTCK